MMDTIRIDIGVYTPLEVDLSEFDFTNISEVILTIKNNLTDEEPIFEQSFTEAVKHNVIISPEDSRKLLSTAKYDFDIITTEGLRLKETTNGQIVLRKGVGQCNQ